MPTVVDYGCSKTPTKRHVVDQHVVDHVVDQLIGHTEKVDHVVDQLIDHPDPPPDLEWHRWSTVPKGTSTRGGSGIDPVCVER